MEANETSSNGPQVNATLLLPNFKALDDQDENIYSINVSTNNTFNSTRYFNVSLKGEQGENIILDNSQLVKTEEIVIVLVILLIWGGVILLFVKKWGKIRGLEPYQPTFQRQSPSLKGSRNKGEEAEGFLEHEATLSAVPSLRRNSSSKKTRKSKSVEDISLQMAQPSVKRSRKKSISVSTK